MNIQAKAIFRTNLRGGAGYHCEQTSCSSMRESDVLQMQPVDESYDVVWLGYVFIWRSYMSVKFAKHLNILRSYLVLLLSKLNKIFLGYFHPGIIIFDNEIN